MAAGTTGTGTAAIDFLVRVLITERWVESLLSE